MQSTEKDPFNCEKCKEALYTIDEVRRHINSYHGAQKASIFRLECWSNVNNHSKYIEWQKAIVNIPHVTFVSMEEKEMDISSQILKYCLQDYHLRNVILSPHDHLLQKEHPEEALLHSP